jgi:hypothetical protein
VLAAGPSEIEKTSAWRRPRLLDIDYREPSTKQAISIQQMERRLTFGQSHKLFDTRLAFLFLTDHRITSPAVPVCSTTRRDAVAIFSGP